jgi:hypothetical protein
MQALCFVGPDLIDLVNRVNTKLLYTDILNNKQQDREYALLNAFELLWNIDQQAIEGASDLDC